MSKKAWLVAGLIVTAFTVAYFWIGVPIVVFGTVAWMIFGPIIAIVIALSVKSSMIDENDTHQKSVDNRIADLLRWKQQVENKDTGRSAVR